VNMSVHEKLVVDLQPVSNVFFSHTFWKELSVLMLHYSAHLFLAGFTVLLLFNDAASSAIVINCIQPVQLRLHHLIIEDLIDLYYEYQNIICN
jgi:hypothetical protein